MKSFSRLKRSQLLLPACAAAVLCVAGCSNQTELLLPEGAFTPGNTQNIPADNASPAPGIGVQRPAGSEAIGGTVNVDDVLGIQPAPVAEPAPGVSVRRPPVKKTATSDVIYKVRKGDTLGAIAKRYKMHWRAVAEYNGIGNNARIFPGQTLRIPAVSGKTVPAAVKKAPVKRGKAVDSGKIHVVKKGEFPGKIAAQYKVRLSDLLALNGITGKKTIFPGQKLRIPKAAPVTAKSAAKKPSAGKAVARKTPGKKKTAKKVQPPKKPVVPVIPRKIDSGDDVLNSIDKADDTAKPAQPAAATSNVTVAPAKEKDIAGSVPTLDLKLEKDMTLEQVSKAYDRSIDVIKKYNPNLKSGEMLKADTVIVVPIF